LRPGEVSKIADHESVHSYKGAASAVSEANLVPRLLYGCVVRQRHHVRIGADEGVDGGEDDVGDGVGEADGESSRCDAFGQVGDCSEREAGGCLDVVAGDLVEIIRRGVRWRLRPELVLVPGGGGVFPGRSVAVGRSGIPEALVIGRRAAGGGSPRREGIPGHERLITPARRVAVGGSGPQGPLTGGRIGHGHADLGVAIWGFLP
jgi:hypothetical protein